MNREKIAVVGGGVAGLSAALALVQKHDVTLFEASSRLGGHAWPYRIRDEEEFDVDTAFLVFNSHSYPSFLKFLSILGLSDSVVDSNMSIGIEKSRLRYSVNGGKRDWLGYLGNSLNPKFLRLLFEIRRFRAVSDPKRLEQEAGNLRLSEFLQKNSFSEYFAQHFAYPLGASVWSLPLEAVTTLPASLYFSFFNNHKILKNLHGSRWKTLCGSSAMYLQAFQKKFLAAGGSIRLNSPVVSVKHRQEKCELQTSLPETFDRAVIATHADDALKLLANPSQKERDTLGTWKYRTCESILHNDENYFPRIAGRWASWNIASLPHKGGFSVTYHLNRIQPLPTRKNYFLSWGGPSPKAGTEIARFQLKHPSFTLETKRAQNDLVQLQGPGIFYCGSYFGNGFHEDAVRSGFAVAEALGAIC